jgi:hypothetical protein
MVHACVPVICPDSRQSRWDTASAHSLSGMRGKGKGGRGTEWHLACCGSTDGDIAMSHSWCGMHDVTTVSCRHKHSSGEAFYCSGHPC